MKKTNIKTFRTILTNDNMSARDLAQLVKINGVLYINRWGDWVASLPGDAATKDVTDTALDEIANYVSAYICRDSQRVEEHYDSSHHPLDNFGFTIGEDNKLFVEKTAVQNLDDQLANLKEENKRLGGVYKPQVNKELVAPELELANKIYREALKKRDPNTNKVEGKTPREWMLATLAKMDAGLEDPAMKRIASVANWDKKQTNKSKK